MRGHQLLGREESLGLLPVPSRLSVRRPSRLRRHGRVRRRRAAAGASPSRLLSLTLGAPGPCSLASERLAGSLKTKQTTQRARAPGLPQRLGVAKGLFRARKRQARRRRGSPFAP